MYGWIPSRQRAIGSARKAAEQDPDVFDGAVLVIDGKETIRHTAKAILRKTIECAARRYGPRGNE